MMAAMTSKNFPNLCRERLSRRKFILLSAVGAAGVASGAAPRPVSPNDKLNIAIVGYGGQGASDARSCATENIVALCDADEKIGADIRNAYPKATYYQDFRKMLDKEKSIDALNVAVPDHLHACIAAAAMQLGKHVYVQKPLAHSVYEARLLRKLAAENKVATQMGNQGSAANGLRRAVEVIQGGIIGQVHDVYVWSNRPIWPQGLERPEGSDPVPEGLDWDLWIGPAPMRPFKGRINPQGNQGQYPNYYHPFNWRGRLDFGTGALGDMACHTCNLPFRALKLGYPTEVEAETVELTKDSYPIKSRIRFQFPAREGLGPVTFRWYDGGNRIPNAIRSPYHDGNNKPPPEVTADMLTTVNRIPGSGCLMVGDKGQIFSPDDYGTQFFLKLKDEKEFSNGNGHPAVRDVPQTIPRNTFQSRGEAHHQEWIAACKGGQPGYSNFDIAAYLTEIMVLGCVAMRAGKKLEWDGPNMLAKNAPEASQFVRPEFRKGWEL
jgi:predicted dehydrogenase